jgi:hypothetical protein
MTDDWVIIYSTNKDYQANLIKQTLLDGGIEAQIMNKSDSSFTSFGEYEIYVSRNNAEKADIIIKDLKSE